MRKDIYVNKAISQIPRILGNMDRNQFSPTYGCCHRDYWLDKTSDFPDAVRQFGIHALAIVYKNKFQGNIYYKNKKIKEWITAGLQYWVSIQHSDGSFDEFYPNERGWVGPTAFTTFSSIESLNLISKELSNEILQKIKRAIHKSANFIIKGQFEEDHLANHHAMACLAVWKSYKLLGDPKLLTGYKKLWKGFLEYHNSSEGWSREYDGIDPGYLSATISFLGKIYQDNGDRELFEVCKQSITTCGYFVYPNLFYGGSMGSRNTLHFYTHGFEIFSKKIEEASVIADKMLLGLEQNKLVSPEIMSDRYLFYRVPEFLQSFVDFQERVKKNYSYKVPFERSSHFKFLENAGIWINSTQNEYMISNLSKGGVIKIFDKKYNKILLNDCGFIGKLSSGKIITTQWINPEYIKKGTKEGFEVSGRFNLVPSNKYFNVPKFIIFRIILVLFGWKPSWAHFIKGMIRKILMMGNRPIDLNFRRKLTINKKSILIVDEVINGGNLKLKNMSVGDEFFIRFVPQSRYFQSQELDIDGEELSPDEIKKINVDKYLVKERILKLK